MTYIASIPVPVTVLFGDGGRTACKAGIGFRIEKVSVGEHYIIGTWAGDPRSVVQVPHRYFERAFKRV